MPDKSKQLQIYLDALSDFLNNPAAVHALTHAPVDVNIVGLLNDLYALCDVPGFTTKDMEWLRSIHISLG